MAPPKCPPPPKKDRYRFRDFMKDLKEIAKSKHMPHPYPPPPKPRRRKRPSYLDVRGYSHLEPIIMAGPAHPGYDQACRELQVLEQSMYKQYNDNLPLMKQATNLCVHEPEVQAMEELRTGVPLNPNPPPLRFHKRGHEGSGLFLYADWTTMGITLAWIHLKLGWFNPKKFRKVCEERYDFIGICAQRSWFDDWDMTAYFDYPEGAEETARKVARKHGWATSDQLRVWKGLSRPEPPGPQIIKC